MDMYGDELYPGQLVFKYPKAGENNSIVSLHLYDLTSNQLKKVALGNDQQYYIPRIQWTSEPNTLAVTTLNRHQNNLNLQFFYLFFRLNIDVIIDAFVRDLHSWIKRIKLF